MNILGLPTAGVLTGSEILYAVQNGVDVKLTPDVLKAYIGATVTANISDGNKGDITVSASGATWRLNGFTAFGKSLGGAVDAAGARAILGFNSGAGGYQPYSSNLDSIAQLLSAANTFPFFTGSGTASLAPITAFGRSILDDADAAAVRTTIGAQAALTITPFAKTILDDTTADEVKATLGITGGGGGTYTPPAINTGFFHSNGWIYLDAAVSNRFSVTLTDNRYLSIPDNPTKNPIVYIFIKQDGTGGRTLGFDSGYKFPGGTAPTINSAANSVTVMTCVFDDVSYYWRCTYAQYLV